MVTEQNMDSSLTIDLSDWSCYDVQYDHWCCPSNWTPQRQGNILFLSDLNDSIDHTFFAITRYDKTGNNMQMNDYIKEVYSQLKTDTFEKILNYSFKEINYQNRKAYYGEYLTLINGKEYICFSMYTNLNQILFDISLKVLKIDKEKYYNIFQNLLYTYKTNGRNLFDQNEKIISVK
ncbi:MAG: hypothetical protein ACTHKV_09995, partial [Flavipsychrobacter sp.]